MVTLKEKVSQLFVCKTPDDIVDIEGFVKEGIGGFMIGKGGEIASFNQKDIEGDSEASLKKFVRLINGFQNKNKKFPLFMAIDGEGGRYFNRLKNISKYKSPRDYGLKYEKDGDLKYFEKEVDTYARLMKRIGLNMNFAPLLDVAKKGYKGYVASEKITIKSPDLTVSEIESSNRAYSDDKEVVRTMAITAMDVFQKHGIIPTMKHFPSYGILDLNENPHISLPVKKMSRNTLMKHIDNYKLAFRKGAYAIMTGHVVTAIDNTRPASLSKKNYKFLREKLKFKGLIVADELNMGSIRDFHGFQSYGKAAIDALKANDILLISHPDTFIFMRDAILGAAKEYREIKEMVDDRYKRVLRYKKKIGLIK